MGRGPLRAARHNNGDGEPTLVERIERVAVAFETATDRLIAETARSDRGDEVDAAQAFPLAGANALTRPIVGRGRLLGYALRETTGGAGATATVLLHSGGDTSGDVIVPITLQSNESVRDWFGPRGVMLTHGLLVEIVAGSVDGALFIDPA